MKLLSLKKSDRKDKEFVAEFDDGKKVHFGTGSNYVLNKKKTPVDRKNYIARHSKNPLEKDALKNPRSAARLSMDLLWNTRNLNTNISLYKKKYNF